jgi:glycosyltransferase involved in cell wall biosynthesis
MRILQVINSLETGGAEKLIVDTLPVYAQSVIMDVAVLNGKEAPFKSILTNKKCCTIISIGKYSVYNPIYILKLIPIIRKYDVIHVHLFPAFYWVAFAHWISFNKAKLVYTEHSVVNRRREHFLLKWIDRWIYRKYKSVISITEAVQFGLKESLGNQKNLEYIIPNGVDLNQINSAMGYSKEVFFSNSSCLILQVARFGFPKDQKTVIESLVYLPEKFKLLLVGDGEELSACKALVHELKLNDRTLFLGMRNDIPELLKTADILVLSSLYEGLSLSCIEGMASGKPFVASDVPGLKEIVTGSGLVFECGNPKELALIFQELDVNPEYYNQIAERCKKRVEDYSIDAMIQTHLQLYQTLINS